MGVGGQMTFGNDGGQWIHDRALRFWPWWRCLIQPNGKHPWSCATRSFVRGIGTFLLCQGQLQRGATQRFFGEGRRTQLQQCAVLDLRRCECKRQRPVYRLGRVRLSGRSNYHLHRQKMMNAKRFVSMIALAGLFGALLYAIVYFMASQSEGFKFAEQKIRSSPAIRAHFGEIGKVRPVLLGPYDQKTVDSDQWMSVAIDVSGSLTSIQLAVRMRKTNGTWTIESAKNEGRNVSLN